MKQIDLFGALYGMLKLYPREIITSLTLFQIISLGSCALCVVGVKYIDLISLDARVRPVNLKFFDVSRAPYVVLGLNI